MQAPSKDPSSNHCCRLVVAHIQIDQFICISIRTWRLIPLFCYLATSQLHSRCRWKVNIAIHTCSRHRLEQSNSPLPKYKEWKMWRTFWEQVAFAQGRTFIRSNLQIDRRNIIPSMVPGRRLAEMYMRRVADAQLNSKRRAWYLRQSTGGKDCIYILVGDDAELAGCSVAFAADELQRRVARGHAAAQYHIIERAGHLILISLRRAAPHCLSYRRIVVSRPPWVILINSRGRLPRWFLACGEAAC